METSVSPLEAAWQEFQCSSPVVPADWEDLRAAFDAGHKAGIAFCMSQVRWDIEDRAGHSAEGGT